jgi:hypothetical protein
VVITERYSYQGYIFIIVYTGGSNMASGKVDYGGVKEADKISKARLENTVKLKRNNEADRISMEEKRAFYTRQLEMEEFYTLMGTVIMTELKKKGYRIYEVADMIGVSYDMFRRMFQKHTALIPAHLIYRLSLLFNLPYHEFFRFVPFKSRAPMKYEKVQQTLGTAMYGIKGWGDEQIKILKFHDEKIRQGASEESWTDATEGGPESPQANS